MPTSGHRPRLRGGLEAEDLAYGKEFTGAAIIPQLVAGLVDALRERVPLRRRVEDCRQMRQVWAMRTAKAAGSIADAIVIRGVAPGRCRLASVDAGGHTQWASWSPFDGCVG